MIQDKINHVIALFAAGDPAFRAAFKAIESELSTAQHWQLLHAFSAEMDKTLTFLEQNRPVLQPS